VILRTYRLLVDEQLSTRAIAKKLTHDGLSTARGAAQWQPTAVSRMLTNPVYKGSYRYHQSGQEEILIPVPPIVDEPTWQATQVQLIANSLYSRRNNRRHRYLLRGLICCPRCGGNYTGYTQRGYSAYRCNRVHWGSSSTGQKCSSGSIPATSLEDAVWSAVAGALQDPQALLDGHCSLLETSNSANALEHERKQVELGLKQTQAQEDRITQAYVN
jgi:site-specific DNA recombinase